MKQVLWFFILVPGFLSCNQESNELGKVSILQTTEKIISNYPTGEPKFVEVYELMDGELQISEFKELYVSGKVRMSGKLNSKKNRSGLWIAYFENGNKWSTGFYQDGQENGKKQVWYEDGKPMYEGEMVNDKPAGKWTFWDEKGNISTRFYE